MSYGREVNYIVQVLAAGWRDVDVVSEEEYVETGQARAATLVKLRQYQAAAPRLSYRAIVRIVEEYPILPAD